MNRLEAYQILTKKMAEYAARTDRDEVLTENVDGPSGTLYTIELAVTDNAKGKPCVRGSIHDNSSMNFSLLEETMDLKD